ncbi:filamentous hemagglutinin N-terminal domain-containing protein [Plectonema cf. radiosum LEGE 06105]|uniref:Filamentous hemagglutinin N-terminal domain-containing protein n=1 Tax=Plectonema cf. radiosum LEGE 06105 TaxID=945769 RepID=A0A8J7JYM4_9CYAN|nr:filamentous hemagglutinin N-terminal domain-containing protein [Plectonema radiosum]MBE9211471.1 filamentous hemagglutinin N-terminal domain-containing protein [Plectonema cf. radiosum LEGE 06105]
MKLKYLLTLFLISSVPQAQAQITPTANDANTIVNQTGNTFTITGGTQIDANLFHSLQKFGLNENQIADFVTNPGTQNVLGRITGGDASVINGLIKITGSDANLFLMNPAGIIFGSGARLDVPGSFTATTANGIGFGNKWFNASGANNYVELIGEPNSFAFTMSEPGAIANDGFGNLAVKTGKNLTFLGGTVVNTRELRAPGGNVVNATVTGQSIVKITQPGNILSLEIQPIAASSSLPNNWSLPILSLPQLLTGGGVTNATGLTISGDEVKLTGSGLKIENGDLLIDALSAGNATLSSSRNLISVGQSGQGLTTSGDLNLLAQNTINLFDGAGVDEFLILQAGGDLKVQGNQNIDIQLGNDKSIFQTGGNLNLVSDGLINGNARFVTGGNFSVQNLSGGTGNFTSSFLSPIGTNSTGIISSNGDVNFGNYTGYSLKVEAKGSISGGDIKITQPNASLVGTDPDIAVLKNSSSLILRAGLTELRNPASSSPTTVEGSTFTNTNTSTSPGNITLENITIEPSANDEILGSVILSAKNNINVNGNISVGNFGLYGTFNGINSPLTLNSSEGNISVTGDIDAGNTILSAAKDINIENLNSISSENGLGSGDDFAFLSSKTGKITVNTISVPFGSIDINAADVFRAKGTFLNSFTFSGPSDVPVSIQAQQNINIQHGGVKLTDGVAVEKDTAGNTIYRVKADGRRVFFRGRGDDSQIIFVDENGNPVPDRPITVNSVAFDVNSISTDESFTAGLIVKKGGVDAGLYGAFGDTFLSGSSDINVVGIPKPNQPTPNEEVVQRQLNQEEKNSICPPQTTVAFNQGKNTRGGQTTTISQPPNKDTCTTANKENILKVVPDNRI